MTLPFSPDRPFWLLGCGNMAGAMLGRWLDQGLDPAAVTIIDPARRDAPAGVRLLGAPPAGEAAPAAILIGVKPQVFAQLDVAGLADRGTLLISIMAGIDSPALGAHFANAGSIVRLMPNLPVALGKGVAILHQSRGDAASRDTVEALARPLGLTLWVESDALIDAGTSVSGSGPAFVYRFIDALAKGAEALGFTPDQAAALALATVDGASALAAGADVSPSVLADRVTSPGGTTRAGLDIMDRDDALATLIEQTLRAAADRAAELAALAR